MSSPSHVIVFGGHGVTGSAIADRLAHDGLDVTTVSRREDVAAPRHLPLDLADPQMTLDRLGQLADDVTHVVYAAYVERPTMTETIAPNLEMFVSALDGLVAAGAPLERVVMIGGGKSYGEHLGAYKTPAKESDRPLLAPVFYTQQETVLAERAVTEGFKWTVLRPDLVIGPGAGAPMSLLNCIAVLATLAREAGAPLRFPGAAGAWTALHQITDARLLASAVAWALTAPAASGEVFNVTNGDLFRWQHVWPDLAAAFDIESGPPQPMTLAEELAGYAETWDAAVARHGLQPTPYEQAASWAFADAVWGSAFDMVQSTVKIRQAGFPDVIDSHDCLVENIRRLREVRFVP